MMEELTKQEFLEGYEGGYIIDVVSIGNKVYGKDSRGQAQADKPFKVVWCSV